LFWRVTAERGMPAEAKSLESAVWRGSGWEAGAGSEEAGAAGIVWGGKAGEVKAARAIAGVGRRRAVKKRREKVYSMIGTTREERICGKGVGKLVEVEG
jgi:hypothetical protein